MQISILEVALNPPSFNPPLLDLSNITRSSVVHTYTVLLCFLAHAPISEQVAIFKYWHTDVNCNIYI